MVLTSGRLSIQTDPRIKLQQRWLMIGHESQWTRPGEYRTFTVAEIPFVVIRGEDGKLRAFHNVCRHRAYAVVRKPSGRSLRLFCRYHGWQYDAAGRLLKAPCFPLPSQEDRLRPGVLDLGENGLFEIHLKIDSGRFVFVNFATNLADAFPWSDISPSRLRALDLSVAEEWEIEVESDWRLASESKKCAPPPSPCWRTSIVILTRRPGLLPWFIDPGSFSGASAPRRLLNYVLRPTANTRLQYVDDASFICDVQGKYHLLVSALPTDSKKTTIRATKIPQHSHRQQASGEEKTDDHGIQKRVNAEIQSAVVALQRHRTTNTNLDYRQSAIRERLDKFNRHVWHHKTLEKAAGKKINVVARVTGFASEDVEAEAICSALERRLGARDSNMTPGCAIEDASGELEW